MIDLTEKSFFHKHVKLLCSLVLTVILINPIVRWKLPNTSLSWQIFGADADAAIQQGDAIRIRSLADIIKEHTEAYIISKANSIGAELHVQVELDHSGTLVPTEVTLCGYFDSAHEGILSDFIVQEIGIQKENQIWIRQDSQISDS